MKKMIKSMVTAALIIWPSYGAAQNYEIVPKVRNKYISAASRDGSLLLLAEPTLTKGDPAAFDFMTNNVSINYSLYDGQQESALTLPATGLGKAWQRRIIAVNSKGQILSELGNFDSKQLHFEIIEANGSSRIIATHTYEDLWSTQGRQVEFNDAGQVAIKVSEDGYEDMGSGKWYSDILYLYDGVSLQTVASNPRRTMKEPYVDGLGLVALSQDGKVAFSQQTPGQNETDHFVRNIDGKVDAFTVAGLGEFGSVLEFANNRILLQGMSEGVVYDLAGAKSSALYPSSKEFTNYPTMLKTFNGSRVVLNSLLRKDAKSFISYIGIAEIGKSPIYLDCPLPGKDASFIQVAPRPDGNTFMLSPFGYFAEDLITYELRPATKSADAQACRTFTSVAEILTAQKTSASQRIKAKKPSKKRKPHKKHTHKVNVMRNPSSMR